MGTPLFILIVFLRTTGKKTLLLSSEMKANNYRKLPGDIHHRVYDVNLTFFKIPFSFTQTPTKSD